MKPRILSIICAIALLAGACNGHGDDAKDQSWVSGGWTFDHNHDVDSDTARAFLDVERVSGSNALAVKTCAIGILTDKATGARGTPQGVCSDWITVPNPNGYGVNVGVVIPHNPATHTLHAYESSVEFRINNGTVVVCQYHDHDEEDAPNPSMCPGRDASGN